MSVLALRPFSTYLRNIKVRNSLQLLHQASWRNVLILRILQKPTFKPIVSQRNFSTTPSLGTEEDAAAIEQDLDEEENEEGDSEEQFIERYLDPKDRSRIISPEISIKYLESVAFKTTYGKDPIWTKYRRNFKGQRLPLKTRETCIRQDKITTGSPCPICRDEYLVIDYRNVELLKHFIDPYTGQILSPNKTNICQKQWRKMLIHMEKARDHGYLDLDCSQTEYDYRDYIKQ